MSETIETPARLLTVREVAKRLNVGTVTVYRRIATGQFPALRMGTTGPLRVDEAEFERWLDEHRTTPREEA